MLIGKNNSQQWTLLGWDSLEEMQESSIYPPRGPNAEGGICFIRKGDKVQAGIYYETASEREILQFPGTVYLLFMDESTCFKGELEHLFKTKFNRDEKRDFEYIFFTVDRRLDHGDESAEYSVPMGYFMHNYAPDGEKNQKIFAIFHYIVEKWPSVVTLPTSLFKIEPQQTAVHHYDVYAEMASREKKRGEIEAKILNNIYEYVILSKKESVI